MEFRVLHMKNINKYIFKVSCVALVLFGMSCSDDDVNDATIDFTPILGIRTESVIENIQEGETVEVEVAIFSDRDNNETVTFSWAVTGAVAASGDGTIAAGEKVTSFSFDVPNNATVDADRSVTVTLSNASIPFTQENIGREATASFDFDVLDDLNAFSISTTDTTDLSESVGMLNIPIDFTDEIDEDVEVTFSVDPSSTAVEGVDYELPDGLTFTVDSGSDEAVIAINILNNLVAQMERRLVINLEDVTGSAEVSLVAPTADNGVTNQSVFNIEDDTKLIKIARLGQGTPVNTDTLKISAAGSFQVGTLVEGGSVTGTLTFDVTTTGTVPAGVTFDVGQTLTYVAGEAEKPFTFTVDNSVFTGLTDPVDFRFVLNNVNTNNGDAEAVLDPEEETSITIRILPQS